MTTRTNRCAQLYLRLQKYGIEKPSAVGNPSRGWSRPKWASIPAVSGSPNA